MPPEPAETVLHTLSADPAAGTSSDNPWLSLLLVFILIFVNGFFAAAEIAVITLNDNKLKKMATKEHEQQQQTEPHNPVQQQQQQAEDLFSNMSASPSATGDDLFGGMSSTPSGNADLFAGMMASPVAEPAASPIAEPEEEDLLNLNAVSTKTDKKSMWGKMSFGRKSATPAQTSASAADSEKKKGGFSLGSFMKIGSKGPSTFPGPEEIDLSEGMDSEAMNLLFSNWKFPENHKTRIRAWIADVVNGEPITELHNKGFNLSSVNGFVAGGFRNCVVPMMQRRPDVNVLFTETPLKNDTYSIRLQAFAQ